MIRAIFCLLSASIILSGCSTSLRPEKTPELLENTKFLNTGEDERKTDVRECLVRADQNVKLPSESWAIVRSVLIGSLIGTAPGAISGAVTGDSGENIAVGAIAGATIGLIQGFVKTTEDVPMYQRFVEHCLHTKDYEIIGWKRKEED